MALVLDKEHYEGSQDAEYLLSLWDEASSGTSDDQYRLAEAYRRSFRISHLQEYALKWYQEAASNGSVDAMYTMYLFIRHRKYGLERDMVRGMEFLSAAALAGNEFAMIDLSWEYLTGQYIAQDFAKALEWSRKAYDGLLQVSDDDYERCNDRATWNLCCSLVAEGSFDSIDEAHHRLYKLMRADSAFQTGATVLVGYINETTPYEKFRGDGFAIHNYSWVMRNSYSTWTACRLADMYYDGRGVEQSYGTALALYRFAAIGVPNSSFGINRFSFNDIAAYRLGRMCEDGIPGVLEPMADAADYWYTVSAYRGYGPAIEKIGFMPEKSPGVSYEYTSGEIGFSNLSMICSPSTNQCLVVNAVCNL